jgi:hypothetical protein
METGAGVPGYSGGVAACVVLAQTVNPFVKYWRARHIRGGGGPGDESTVSQPGFHDWW